MNHPVLKTGKLPPVADSRTLMYESVLRAPVKLPKTYSVPKAYPGARPHMFLNDTYGDCVIAARAELQQWFDLERIGAVPKITDAEVKKEYFKETGGVDSGLVISDSLKAYRKGWIAGGKKRTIEAFAAVNIRNVEEVKQAIYLHGGVMIGVELPADAMDAFEAGKAWTNTKPRPDPEEGHCIPLMGWTETGFTGITWAQYQQMTNAWLSRFGDEGWALIDSMNQPRARKAIDFAGVRRHLELVAA